MRSSGLAKTIRLAPCVLAFVASVSMARQVNATGPDSSNRSKPPSSKQLRPDEDWSYLSDPLHRTDLWDKLKYIPVGSGKDWYVSIGGEGRWRFERFENASWGAGSQDNNGFFLQRYMLHADLHTGSGLRFFGQIKSGLVHGRTGGARPTDEDKLDLHQAFADLRVNDKLTIRAGRQELLFGSSRLVGIREKDSE